MMAKIIRPGKTLLQNYREIIFVFLAFALMVMAANFTVGRILRDRLLDRAEEMISAAEANVRAGLSEAENVLLNSHHIVQGMIEQNASSQEILDYLTVTTEWARQRDQGLLEFYGIYGYIHGEFYDSIGLNPGSDFVPQTRPWYQTAIRSGTAVGYTTPYIDWRTGNTIVSAVRNIDVTNGGIVGILTADININWLVEYVSSLGLVSGGYGILLSQNMTLMAHPDSAYIGLQLQNLGGSYEEIARILRSGGEVSARRIEDSNGNSVITFFTRIFNGWYMGIVIPYHRFYQDLYLSALILVILGVVLSLALCFILLRISAAKVRSDEESKAKSSFLASMSHEIRTPMNAIIGMAELLLRGDLPTEARSQVHDIKQAGNNLISIINDILDFSKIEAGKLEILPAKYLLSSLINDTVNIIRMRLAEKPIQFFTNIDGQIPNSLIGDEVRLRQILLNLLSNSVKYSQKGNIGLTITMEQGDGELAEQNKFALQNKSVLLKIAVSDTGKGIKPEDQAKLFDEFSQVDRKKNMGIEGTGLGLAITKRLCVAMGGDISVESEYGKGSVFTVIIPQGIESETPFAEVEEPEQKKVLVYERRAVCSKSVSWSLKNMKVPHRLITNPGDFADALSQEEWFYVFCGSGLYREIRPIMNDEGSSFSGLKKPSLALMVDWGAEVNIPNTRFLYVPIQSLSIANILNGKEDSKGYTERDKGSGAIRFTLKSARLLIVDDILTNLKVAEGLLMPYQAGVDTCLSGREAVELVKRREYDIVFMDHMMPDMDGIEATTAIREWEMMQGSGQRRQVPIIALTANAISGMKEMFIEKGFNDFLAKPIDVSKLDEMLDRWIEEGKKGNGEKGNGEWGVGNGEGRRGEASEKGFSPPPDAAMPLPAIPGVDVQRGIAMTGGDTDFYHKVLSMFGKDVQERLPFLQTMPDKDTLPAFVTQVHALKSASASIGAADVSALAAQLEDAGRNRDGAFIEQQLPVFAEQLAELAKNITIALEADGGTADSETTAADALVPHLRDLSAALQSMKADDIDRIMEEITRKPLNADFKAALEQISSDVLMAEFDKAIGAVDELIGKTEHSG